MRNLIFPAVVGLGSLAILARLVSLGVFSSDEPFVINLKGPKNEQQVFGTRVSDYISRYGGRTLLEWPSQHLVEADPPLAIVMISSRPESKPRRMVIRETWKRWCVEYRVKFVFVMSLPGSGDLRNLFLESLLFDDLVIVNQDPMEKSPYRSAVKALLMFQWLINFYQDSKAKPRYVIKAEDDVFLHIPNIINFLQARDSAASGPLLGGSLHLKQKVIRDPSSKYFTSMEQWPKPLFPPHLGRSFYLISSELIPRLLKASFKVELFPMEDVYITGMLASQKLGVKLSRMKGVVDTRSELQSVLRYKNNIWEAIAYHGVDPFLMRYLYKSSAEHVRQTYGN